ncbi:MAG: hypothetical protein J4O03_10030 [Chloroflexi bacterium]|nr:hypothetical protein [Chloroflexota bacterium]MCI0866631.1 hypothetical protein [Chloroflexota bacterium]MCI0878041.1 hypothetical protein [Chloroflexota bacterium]
MTKSFMLLLAVFLALGGAFGGVFAGGVAFGKTQGVEIDLPSEANPLRQQLQNQSHLGALTGVIEKVDGNTVTVNTSQGPQSATLGVDTMIRRFAEGTPSDLQPGMRVTLVGQPGVDGIVEARSVLLNPEDAYGFLNTGFFSRDSQHWEQISEGDALTGREDQGHAPNPGGFFFGGGQQHGPGSGGGGGGSFGHP